MADILIRGISLPEDELKYVSLWVYGDGRVYVINNASAARSRKLQDLAAPLPEGHGRLIDAERFRVILCRLKERQNDDVAIHALNWAIECLDKLDTIVPAEGGADNGS